MPSNPWSVLSLCACIGLLLGGCASPALDVLPEPTPSPMPSHPALLPTATLTIPPSPTPTPSPDSDLDPEGPWLAILAGDTLLVVDADASSVARLQQHEFSPWETDFAVSSTGGLVALKNVRDGLSLAHVPSMELEHVAELLPPDREYTEEELAEAHQWFDDSWAVSLFLPSLAWSHGDSLLAFVSAMDGISPDIYSYNPGDHSTAHLTTAPAFAMYPQWSPDDKYILHDAANAVAWGKSGRGHRISAVWIAPSDLSTPREVFRSAFANEKGFEHRLGWISNSAYVGSSEPEWCPPTNLRTISIEDASAEPIWSGSFLEAVLDPESATLLLLIPPDDYPWTSPECAPSQPSGLYLVSATTRDRRLLGDFLPSAGTLPAMQWSPRAHLFFFHTDAGLVSVSATGEIEVVTTGDVRFPEVSPDGRYWALASSRGDALSVLVPGGEARPIHYGPSGATTWAPDGSALFFLGQSKAVKNAAAVYVAHPPDFRPVVVVDGIDLDPTTETSPFAWVNP